MTSGSVTAPPNTLAPRAAEAGEDAPAINPTHEAADAFWKYWKANGDTHKHGYYESTWGAINAALHMAGTTSRPSSRPAIIEECARVCDEGVTWTPNFPPNIQRVSNETARLLAKAIRALAPGGQNAAPQAKLGIESTHDRGASTGPAVAAPEVFRTFQPFTVKMDSETAARFWDAVEALRAAPPAPAEVAEGAMENPMQAEAMENDMMFARCQVEAMREAIRRAVEDFEKISVRARISSANPSLYELENLLDVIAEVATKRGSDLEQALNERKEI